MGGALWLSRTRLINTFSVHGGKIPGSRDSFGCRSRATEGNLYPSWSEGVGPFHGEAGLADLGRIRWGDAGELRTNVVDHVDVAVRPVVIPQAQIGADGLRVLSIALNDAGRGHTPVKRRVSL